MAQVKLTILGTSKDGFKTSGSIEADDFAAAAAQYQNLKDFAEAEGWQPDGARAAAAQFLGATPVPANTSSAGGYTCIFDGTTIQGMEVEGTVYTAEKIATGRADKMQKMGKPQVGPVCDDCWKKKGLSADWKYFYASQPKRGRY